MELRLGDKIWRIGPLDLIRHYGIVVSIDPSRTIVAHNRKGGGVVLDDIDRFAAGRTVHIESRAPVGYEAVVAQNARKLVGTKFDLFSFNCEHMATLAQEGTPRSGQLQTAAETALLIGAAAGLIGLIWSSPEYDPFVDRYRDRKGRFTRG